MSKLIARPASRATYEDSLVPNLMRCAVEVESIAARLIEVRSELDQPNHPNLADCERGYKSLAQMQRIALRKFRLCFRLAVLQHGEEATVLAAANFRG